jgi:hypothetical protein
MKAALVTATVTAGVAAVVAVAPAAAIRPRVHQLVVFRSGVAKQKTTRARQVTVKVGRRRCAVHAGTPLAALAASRVARIGLHDYGSCSKRPRDAAGLFVRKLGPDANRGQDGWVYKVGRKSGSAGAADPSGPFGRGRLRSGAHVLWFYCHMHGSSCQRTLAFGKVRTQPGGAVRASVRAYDDRGRGIPAAGVTVQVGSASATTDANGVARVAAGAGSHSMYADGGGYVRSFSRKVALR